MNCLFCNIIKNEIPSKIIYEDEIVKVFLDISPDSNGHMLIIPKKHYLDLLEIDNQTLSHIMDIARIMIDKLKQKLQVDGVTLIQNNGDIQEVKHFHLHLKPYYKISQTIKPIDEVYNILTK